jgi:hypothetical protein
MPTSSSKTQRWFAWFLSGFAVLFLVFDGVTKLMKIQVVTDTMAQLGYPADLTVTIGTILLVCTALYVIPTTAVFGAVLLTAYFGGAISTNLRVGNPMFTHVLFPVYLALFIWGGLYLRDARVRALIPFRGSHA